MRLQRGGGMAAPTCVFVLLLVVYLATLAPDVTFWDAGELAAAAHSLGIPHPPGTPLWIAIANVWARALGLLGLAPAVALNALSAACTAGAGAVTTWLVARWRVDAWGAAAAGLGVGTMSTIWLNATETEVYAASLLHGVLALACAERRGAGGDARWLVATAYCLGLAGPLHLSALVVAPGAIVLAARRDGGWHVPDALLLLGATLLATGLGSAAALPAAAGVLAMLAATRSRRGGSHAHALTRGEAARAAAAVLVAASALAIMLVRARHDPVVNQGDPSTLARFADVVARRQYDLAPLWPRRAPAWLQLANVLQYAELQVGLGLSALPTVSPARTVAAFAWMGLAAFGAVSHRRRHPRSWLAVLVLLLAGSLGVAAQLNLRAGPTIGWGILPDDAPHEARERDYFFIVAWWAWGTWAGIGACALATRRHPALLALAALPLVLNWRGVSRRLQPEASLPSRVARALLESAPPGAVLFARGDNDSYPLWYQQVARGLRRDVTVVTVPLLGATWYRAELARRHGLLDSLAVVRWRGERETLRAIAARAVAAQRPVAVSAAMPRAERDLLAAGGWRLHGLVWRWDWLQAAPEPTIDSAAAAGFAARAAGVAPPDAGIAGGIAPSREPVARWARRLLNCPVVAARVGGPGTAAQLDSLCNVR